MSYKKWSRIIGFLLCISLTLCFESMVLQVNAAEKQGGRIINVVYDDSGSMVKTDDGKTIPRWSQAKYSLEVFTAMLNENDKMNIYPMSYQGSLGYTLTGKDKNRVKTVHDMNSSFSNTPFAAVQSAGQDLMNDSSGAEKWLVIITDGEFDDGATPKTTVQTTIDSYNARGIKVAYLAIGNDATVLDGDPASGFYTEKASDGVDVLKKVTSIANQIFEHLVLPDDYISGSNGKTTLTFDIPTKQIIVFAQGDNVKISDMQSNGQQIKAAEIENVKFSDVLPENYPDAVVDNSLKGVVATFESGNEPYSEGTFEISVTGAKTVEYYYSPGVVVNADLLYGDKPVNENAELYSGDYKVSMNFVNPLTGKKVESKLLSDAKFSLAVTNNGNKQVIDSDSGNMSLAEGDVELLALAQLPGQVELSDKKDYVVLPEPISLGLKTDKASYTYVANEIADQTAECILTATNEDSGELLSENEWNNTEIKVETKGGVEYAAMILVTEVYNFLNGYTWSEYERNISGEGIPSHNRSAYYKLRRVYEELLPGPLLVSHTGNEYLGKEGSTNLLEAMCKSEDVTDREIGNYFLNLDKKSGSFDTDLIKAVGHMMRRKSVVICSPFYRDLTDYLLLPLISTSIFDRKCLVITGRDNLKEDVKAWIETMLYNYGKNSKLWRVELLDDIDKNCEIGILSISQVYDVKVLNVNRKFFENTDFILVIEPSRMLATAQVGLNIIAEYASKNYMPIYEGMLFR